MILNETFTLSNGKTIPKLALGTWQMSESDAYRSTLFALQNGYLHIDTAVVYGNESAVGKAIKDSKIPREKLFITTKIPAFIKTEEETRKVIVESLERLQLDYVDLMLIHAPKPWDEIRANSPKTYFDENRVVWKVMREKYDEGIFKSIGVSNFEIKDIENLNFTGFKPQVNQIRVHIGHTPEKLIEYCKANDILVEAYSPNATGHLKGHEVIENMAQKYGVSVPQLGIKYDLQLGLLPLPKSTHEEYILENCKMDFEISKDDMKTLLKVPEIDHH